MVLVILSWIILGLVVGFIASKLVNLRGDEPLIGIGAAVAGAATGGLIHWMMSADPVIAWGFGNILWASIGAAIAVALYHVIRGRSISKDSQTVRTSY